MRPELNPVIHAYRTGWRRALIRTRILLTTPSEVLGALIPAALAVVVLLFLRGKDFEGAPVSLGSMNLPSFLGMNIVFGGLLGVVGVLAMDRTNGTLLRAKSMPGGMTGYLVGELASITMFITFSTAVVLAVGLPLFDGLDFSTPARWLMFLAVLCMGIIATLPLGAVLGALIDNPKNMGLVFLPVMAVVAISGIFYPITALPGWLQGVGQAMPIYWTGLGMRHALLPDSMATVEIGDSWRTLTMFAVLGLWAVVSMALAPPLLRRMARRESGSAVAERRAALQRQLG